MYNKIREKFPLIPAQGAIKIYKEVLSAVRSIKSNKRKNAKTPQRKHLSLHLDKRMYNKLSVDGIFLSTPTARSRELCTFVLYDKVKELFASYTFADPLIFAKITDYFCQFHLKCQQHLVLMNHQLVLIWE